MELRHDIAWDGKGDFDAWKKTVLSSLADTLRARFTGFGETVKLSAGNLQVRRGRTWGFDISLGSRKVGTDAVELKLDYGCRLLDDSMGPGLALSCLVALAAAVYWIRHLWYSSSSASRSDLGMVLWGPLILGLAVFCLWIACVSQLAKFVGKPPDRSEFERLMEEVKAFTGGSSLLPPDGPHRIVRKHIRPRLGEEIVFDSAHTELEWIARIRDEYAKTPQLLPLTVDVAGGDISFYIPTVEPDLFQSAFFGRIEKSPAGGVLIRGKFKVRPLPRLVLSGLGAIAALVSCALVWGEHASMYQPVLVAAGLYGLYRFLMWADGDNREEVTSLIEAGGA